MFNENAAFVHSHAEQGAWGMHAGYFTVLHAHSTWCSFNFNLTGQQVSLAEALDFGELPKRSQ